MVESDLRLIDPATFGQDEGNIFKDEGACVPHHMFCLYVGTFSCDDLCEESESFSE